MVMAYQGLAKLNEECGEVVQVFGKIVAVGGMHNFHWSGDLTQMLEDEIADVLAACRFAIERNAMDLNRIGERADRKYELFCEWDKKCDIA